MDHLKKIDEDITESITDYGAWKADYRRKFCIALGLVGGTCAATQYLTEDMHESISNGVVGVIMFNVFHWFHSLEKYLDC